MAIEIGYDAMLRQSPMAVHDILLNTVINIDKVLGDGYSQKHPELVAACVTAATSEFNNSSMIVAIQEATEKVSAALEEVARSLSSE
jgi:hypothetical protein